MIHKIKLLILPNCARPGGKIGPILGQKGVNIAEFCKKFNDKSAIYRKNILYPVEIKIGNDKKFTFVIKTPPVTQLVKMFTKIDKFSSRCSKNFVGSVHWSKILKISLIKRREINITSLKKTRNIIIGSIMSMGLYILK